MKASDKFDVNEFKRIYKGAQEFCGTRYFSLFIDFIGDEKLLDNIIFANDYLKVPPIKSMLLYYRSKGEFNAEMNTPEKQSLGACFGYLFRYLLGYENAMQVWVGDRVTTIKSSSIFKR